MIRVLHSIIDCGDLPVERLKENYFHLAESRLKVTGESDVDIYEFVSNYFLEFNEAPSLQTVADHFEEANDFAVQERLKEVKAAKGYGASQFRRLVQTLFDKQRQNNLELLLRDVARILTQGLKVGKETKKGVRDAVTHFLSQADELLTSDSGEKTTGDILDEGDEVISEYQHGKANPQLGRLMGLEKIDEVCKGQRPGELMLCLGYVGHCKTTLSLNYAYNTAVFYGWNVMYFSLEMMRPQIRRIIYAMHSSHQKFTDENSPDYNPCAPLDYRKIRDYELSREEEEFFKIVVNDFTKVREWRRPDGFVHKYGKIIIEKPIEDITIPEIKLKAELENSRNELGLLVIDHAGLVENTTGRSVDNYSVGANYVIKDAARLATNFNEGKGVPVFMPFQANRTGWREAMKNEGHYKLDALSYANEAEKSSSVIIYVYLDDELRDRGELKIGCLKNRDNPHFKQFTAKMLWDPRRLLELNELETSDLIESMEL